MTYGRFPYTSEAYPKHAPPLFRQALREVDENTWIVGGKVLISRHTSETSGPCWGDGKGGAFFTVTEAETPPPCSRPLSYEQGRNPFVQLRDYHDSGAAWEIGLATLDVVRYEPGTTQEHVTLDALEKRSLSFHTPHAYYHGVHDGFYYIIYSKLMGTHLSTAWPKIKDKALRNLIVKQVAEAQKELSAWHGNSMTGVDGKELKERLLGSKADNVRATPEELLQNCNSLGMDCSTLAFTHNFMWPYSILIDWKGLIGIVDWEHAGFLPMEWNRTKLNNWGHLQGATSWSREDRVDWTIGLDAELEKLGFPEESEKYMPWREAIDGQAHDLSIGEWRRAAGRRSSR